jgi:exopolysaccharide biosynthesis polyprenyl glycosylphosphotransferase
VRVSTVGHVSTTSAARIARQRRLRRGRTLVLAGVDLVALGLAYAATYVVAEVTAGPAVSAPAWFLALLLLVAVPGWIALFTAYRLYENDALRISVPSVDEVGSVFHAVLSGSLVLLLGAQILRRTEGWLVFSAIEAVVFVGAATMLVPIWRGVARSWILPRVMRRRRALIVGTGTEAQLLGQKLASDDFGHDVVGYLADSLDGHDGCRPVLGSRADIARVVDELDVDRVILASSIASHDEMLDLVRAVRRPDVHVTIVPRYHELFTSSATLDDIGGVPLVSLPATQLSRSARVLKRAVDLVIASIALLLLAPFLLIVAAAIRLNTKGPVIYRQDRRGRDGRIFRIAKFRTMYVDAEARRQHAELVAQNDVDGPLFKIKSGDPRITKVGSLLRRTSIDELPQLWNVLKGEMSLVGPRPFVVHESDQITGWASRRLDLTPGITGLWQVLGRNDLPFEEMVKLDYLYVTNWSLWWDIKILCQTVPVVLRRKGAY